MSERSFDDGHKFLLLVGGFDVDDDERVETEEEGVDGVLRLDFERRGCASALCDVDEVPSNEGGETSVGHIFVARRVVDGEGVVFWG